MQGRSYLDMLNNVAVLGHGHPRMVAESARQWSLLNTNSRFHYAAITEFSERLLDLAGWQHAGDGLFMARERHLQALARVGTHLDGAHTLLAAQAEHLDLMAEELRLAQQALGEITGEFSSDDLLGRIFSSFCIGK